MDGQVKYFSSIYVIAFIQCSTFYKEALDNVVLYNAQIIREKISRLPYIDAQTGIAQKGNGCILTNVCYNHS